MSTVPLPYWHEDAPGLAEGSGLGAVVGAIVGVGLGGIVGVDDPPHEGATARAATTGRVRQGLIFIPLVTPIRTVRILKCNAWAPPPQTAMI